MSIAQANAERSAYYRGVVNRYGDPRSIDYPDEDDFPTLGEVGHIDSLKEAL